jgi:hypothetical protein
MLRRLRRISAILRTNSIYESGDWERRGVGIDVEVLRDDANNPFCTDQSEHSTQQLSTITNSASCIPTASTPSRYVSCDLPSHRPYRNVKCQRLTYLSRQDAAGAALFAACKIEDTLKKSRDILCAAHNLKVPRQQHLSPDDPIFESHSRTIIGLERLMLEAAGFDFRSRHPQTLLIKLLKHYEYARDSRVTKIAYKISLDMYRTFAPLKQVTVVLAMACLELAVRLVSEIEKEERREEQEQRNKDRETDGAEDDNTNVNDTAPDSNDPPHTHTLYSLEDDYPAWKIERAMITETLHDLLDLYIQHRASTALSPLPLDIFLQVRIPLNEEMDRRKLPRYTNWVDTAPGQRSQPQDSPQQGSGRLDSISGVKITYINGSSQSHSQQGPNTINAPSGPRNSHSHPHPNTNPSPRERHHDPYHTAHSTSPSTNSSGGIGSASTNATAVSHEAATGSRPSNAGIAAERSANGMRQRIGERGRDGTVRFMLEPGRERRERGVVGEFEG